MKRYANKKAQKEYFTEVSSPINTFSRTIQAFQKNKKKKPLKSGKIVVCNDGPP